MIIRKALMGDVSAIHKILNHYANQNLLLPRSLSELYDHLKDYYVLEDDDHAQSIRGVCGLRICWEDLAEIKSLAIYEDQQGKGFGIEFVHKCIEEARSLGIKKVFVLTYIPAFFKRIGFREVDKSLLPHKVWADCLNCPNFPDCGETALLLDL